MTVASALVLGHAAFAGIALVGAGLPRGARHRLVQGLAGAGVAVTVVLYVMGDAWRSADLGSPHARIAIVGAAATWLLILVGDRRRGDWYGAACAGVAATGTVMAASNRWVVPLLLFGACGTAALFLLLRDAHPGSLARFSLLAGDVLIASGLVGASLAAGEWTRPEGLAGWHAVAVAGGTVARIGVIPLVGLWGALTTPSAAAIPLVVAGGFAVPLRSLHAEPWVAVALLCGCLAVVAWSLLHRDLRIGLVGIWPVMLGLAAAFAASAAEGPAGVHATVGCTAVALWPWTLGRGQVERGLLLSFLPLTVGSAAISVAAGAAFTSATRTSGSPFISWTLVVGLLPLALLGGVLLSARVGAAREPDEFEPSAVLALWGLMLVSVLLWLGGPDGAGRSGADDAALQVVAVAGAFAAGTLTRGRAFAGPQLGAPAGGFVHTVITVRPAVVRLASAATLVVGLVGAVLIVWFVYEGLRLGFL